MPSGFVYVKFCLIGSPNENKEGKFVRKTLFIGPLLGFS